MQEFTITVINKLNQSYDHTVYAPTMDDAVEKLLDKISYDVRELYCEDQGFIG